MDDLLQEGIHFRPGETPPPHFSIIFLELSDNYDPQEIRMILVEIWKTIELLKVGLISDIPDQFIDPMGLTVLIGYGSSFFDKLNIPDLKPSELKRFKSPNIDGGGRVSLGSGLSYESSITHNLADSSIAIQFTGNSSLTVRRAIVEIWKTIEKHDRSTGKMPISIKGSYTGFGREDKRSWIDFFDGTSNLRSDQRLAAIEIKERSYPTKDRWKEKGTYMCFMRIRVSISDWQKLTRTQQEIIVGRDKVTGCPIVDISSDSDTVITPGCPVTSGGNIEDPENKKFRVAPRPIANIKVRQSHIHRANQGRSTSSDPESRLIFRQGYEFFNDINLYSEPDLGLNFVSFQDTPERILGMLKLPDWLGGVNFGGDQKNQLPGMSNLLRIQSAGFFVVPPKDISGGMPGNNLFDYAMSPLL